jgi:NAD(P)-dependent dehydrogenase (short-subunit alcohol dehydrogenase family)
LIGPIRTIKAFLPHFHQARDGDEKPQIINISSGGGHFGFHIGSLYHSSKGALELLSESLNFEFGSLKHPIQVKVIVPFGGVDQTNFFQGIIDGGSAIQNAPEGTNTGEIDPQAKADYTAYYTTLMQKFQSMAGSSMPATMVAEKIWEATTDGKDKLRYFVGTADSRSLLKFRNAGALVEDEDFDEIDDRYVKNTKAFFG